MLNRRIMKREQINMKYLIITLVVLSIFCEGKLIVDALQSWIEEPKYSEVNPGGSVVIPCRVLNKKGECRWEKSGDPVGIFLGKYEWAAQDPSEGDCSLRIYNSSLEYDDGMWQCQITPSSFMAKDGLTSSGAMLVVRQSPTAIEINQVIMSDIDESGSINGKQVMKKVEENVRSAIAKEGRDVNLECVVKGGNPAVKISWQTSATNNEDDSILQLSDAVQEDVKLTGGASIVSGGGQMTTGSAANFSTRWISRSKLRLKSLKRSDNGKIVYCLAHHPTLKHPLVQQIALNIFYPPTVRIESDSDLNNLESGKDSVTLKCVVDSNPKSIIQWTHNNKHKVEERSTELTINPVGRQHSGSFSCSAQNSQGKSESQPILLDVKYGPTNIQIGNEMSDEIIVDKDKEIILTCNADANPRPKFQWIQKTRMGDANVRASGRKLVIPSASYSHQGQYVCQATNEINNREISILSRSLTVEVKGRPELQPLKHRFGGQEIENVFNDDDGHQLTAFIGENVKLQVPFCADPLPKIAWHLSDGQSSQVNNVILATGTGHGRFVAESLKQSPIFEDCYVASLLIENVKLEDGHGYQLKMSNQHGTESHIVRLNINDRLSSELMFACVIGGTLTLVVLFILAFLCCYNKNKKQRCGRRSRNSGQGSIEKKRSAGGLTITNTHSTTKSSSDVDSEKTDIESTHSCSHDGSFNNENPIMYKGGSAQHFHANHLNIPPTNTSNSHSPNLESFGQMLKPNGTVTATGTMLAPDEFYRSSKGGCSLNTTADVTNNGVINDFNVNEHFHEQNEVNSISIDFEQSRFSIDHELRPSTNNNNNNHHHEHVVSNYNHLNAMMPPLNNRSNHHQHHRPSPTTMFKPIVAPTNITSSNTPPATGGVVSYSDLCFPKTSNYGSMKKKKRKALLEHENAIRRLKQLEQTLKPTPTDLRDGQDVDRSCSSTNTSKDGSTGGGDTYVPAHQYDHFYGHHYANNGFAPTVTASSPAPHKNNNSSSTSNYMHSNSIYA